MKDIKMKQRFLELRAQDKSLRTAADHREYHSFFAEIHRRQEHAEIRGAQKLPAERLRRPGDGIPPHP